jgi:hypothetical protein
MDYLSLTDLFLVGLALDIVGAVLLARGLLLSPEQILRLSTTAWDYNAYLLEDRCKSRTAAEFGIAYLAGGFAFQAIGYGAEVAGVESASSPCRLIAAVILSLAMAAAATYVWLKFSRPRTDSVANQVLQQQWAEEKRDWESTNSERQLRGETPLPLPGHLKDVPRSPWLPKD